MIQPENQSTEQMKIPARNNLFILNKNIFGSLRTFFFFKLKLLPFQFIGSEKAKFLKNKSWYDMTQIFERKSNVCKNLFL